MNKTIVETSRLALFSSFLGSIINGAPQKKAAAKKHLLKVLTSSWNPCQTNEICLETGWRDSLSIYKTSPVF
jgi:hypothetical protein